MKNETAVLNKLTLPTWVNESVYILLTTLSDVMVDRIYSCLVGDVTPTDSTTPLELSLNQKMIIVASMTPVALLERIEEQGNILSDWQLFDVMASNAFRIMQIVSTNLMLFEVSDSYRKELFPDDDEEDEDDGSDEDDDFDDCVDEEDAYKGPSAFALVSYVLQNALATPDEAMVLTLPELHTLYCDNQQEEDIAEEESPNAPVDTPFDAQARKYENMSDTSLIREAKKRGYGWNSALNTMTTEELIDFLVVHDLNSL
ncbi:hypothetical protein fHeYen902_162 [Yersinia phage fHe-Yen9-02]|nr:hypothetical protein fHeYen902_162 [Yersinia phage fHe-Yen9-02]